MAYDNVIIFGAGASADAGIPMLNSFVDTMWGYSVRGKSKGEILSADDKELFLAANKIRVDLERYNSRANFQLKNLEDILSLLSFEAISDSGAQKNYDIWVKAITRTIELSTLYPIRDTGKNPEYKRSDYHNFWNAILGPDSGSPPALITFNYDLVLERTLWDYFHHSPADDTKFRPRNDSCGIKYFLKPYDFTLQRVGGTYMKEFGRPGWITTEEIPIMRPVVARYQAAATEIPYLKLHGSLNWCSQTTPRQDEDVSENLIPTRGPMEVYDSPLILPPVFNKMNARDVSTVWKAALNILREAKHIILVGYSLPKTDIYMQYFLKSAVGPNSNLQRIIVFNPVLFTKQEENEDMRNRFKDCFSPQFQSQITFEPPREIANSETDLGKFSHFLTSLVRSPNSLLFKK